MYHRTFGMTGDIKKRGLFKDNVKKGIDFYY